MAKQFEVYKCAHCGNLLEVLFAGAADPACCGEPMKLMAEGTTDGAKEKHVPVIEKTASGYKVKVGAVAHPMEEKHWIQWIELLADGIGMLAALLAAGNLSFWLCDRALAALTRYYHVILKPKLKKKF